MKPHGFHLPCTYIERGVQGNLSPRVYVCFEGLVRVRLPVAVHHERIEPESFISKRTQVVEQSDNVFSKDALLSHITERKRTGIPLNPCLVGRRVVPTAR